MKILAIEKEMEGVAWQNLDGLLKEEAQHVFDLYLSGFIREIYFTENKNAVLILECDNKTVANHLLSKLPLVKKGLIDFETLELQPYTGLSRLMEV